MEKAIIYLRVSSEDQTEISQLNPCKDFCNKNNFEVIKILKDHSRSAYHNTKRKGYEIAKEMIRNKEAQHVVVFALDRWQRKGPKELRATHRFFKACNAKLHSVREYWVEGLQNMPDGLDEVFIPYIYDMLAWLAKEESKKIGDRVKNSTRYQKALKKGKVGRPDIPDETIDEIKELLKKGESYRNIRKSVTYKAKHGKVKHPSVGKIAEIKKRCSKIGIKKVNQKNN